MKKYLWSLLLTILTMTLCTACGDDENDDSGTGDTGSVNWKAGITEKGNTLTFAYEEGISGYNVKYKEVYTFENDKLVKLDFVITYPNKQLADIIMEELKSDPEASTYFKDLKQNGSSITYSYNDSDLFGQSKADIKRTLELRLAQMNNKEA